MPESLALPLAIPSKAHLLKRIPLAILDQGLFAGTTFVTNLLAARWLGADGYGTFAIAYSLLLFLAAFYNALICEPVMVFAAGRYAGSLSGYAKIIARWHWQLTIACAVVLALVGGIWMQSSRHGAAVFSVGCAFPGVMLLWSQRSLTYAAQESLIVPYASCTYLFVQVAALLILHALSSLSVVSAFISVGVAGLCAGSVLQIMLRSRLAKRQSDELVVKEVRREHWRYARWASGTSLIGWTCSNVHYLILSASAGLAAVGSMRVLDNTLTPYQQGLTALTQLALPMASAAAARSLKDFSRSILTLALIWSMLSIVAVVAIALFSREIVTVLYGARYVDVHGNLAWYALMLIPYSVSAALMIGCRALSRSDLVFYYHAVYAIALTLGYALFAGAGMAGIIYTNVIVQCATAPLLFRFLKKATVSPC